MERVAGPQVPGCRHHRDLLCLGATKDCTRSTEAEPGMGQQRAAEAEGHEYTEDNEQFDDV